MTYLRYGVEFADLEEMECYRAMRALVHAGRTGNSSQIARQSGLSRSAVDRAMTSLAARGYVRDAYKGNAHHWRATAKIPAIEGPAITAPESAPSPSTTLESQPCGMSAIGVTGHDRVNATLTEDARHRPQNHDCRELGRHDLPHVMLAQPGDVQTCPACGIVRRVGKDGRVTYQYPARPAAPDDAPAWNCVSYPGEGMHYVSDGRCRWCGMTRGEIEAQRIGTPGSKLRDVRIAARLAYQAGCTPAEVLEAVRQAPDEW